MTSVLPDLDAPAAMADRNLEFSVSVISAFLTVGSRKKPPTMLRIALCDSKGTIEEGKLADFVILSDDPTAIDPEALDKLKVLMTIKEGNVIYALEQ